MGTWRQDLCTFFNISLNSSENEQIFQTKLVEKIKTYILCTITVFRKSCPLWDKVEKYGRARQTTNDSTLHMRFACVITKATDTHSECVILIAFPRK